MRRRFRWRILSPPAYGPRTHSRSRSTLPKTESSSSRVGRPTASTRPVPLHPQATTVEVRAELLQNNCLPAAIAAEPAAKVEDVISAVDRVRRTPPTAPNGILLNGIVAPELPEPAERLRAALLAEYKEET